MQQINWDEVKEEWVSPNISRRLIYLNNVMVAKLFLRKGTFVPEHHHESEQITWVFKGALEFQIQGRKIVVGEGQVLPIPSNVPHAATAIEDTEEVDIFSPIRRDWLEGRDSYLRGT
jgi:quercetin dioxygenase-like cupin family protein